MRRQLRLHCCLPAAARSFDRHAAIVLRELRARASVVGEHPDSRLPWTAWAMRDVWRADSLPPFPRRTRPGVYRALSLLRISAARRDRAFRAMRRAVDHRD